MLRTILSLVALLALFGCGDNRSHDHEPARLELIMLGDSITWNWDGYSGVVAGDYEPGEARIHAWPGYSTREFRANRPFYAAGDIDIQRPGVATILLGDNDALRTVFRPPIPAAEYLVNLEDLVERLLRDGVDVVYLMTPLRYFPPFSDGVSVESKMLLAQYADAVRWLCASPDDAIECGPDLYDLVRPEHTNDGLHPNYIGSQFIGDLVLESLGR